MTATDQIRAPANNSPGIAVDPTDRRFVALASRLDAPDFGCALHVSGDQGRTWIPVSPITKLPQGVEKCYSPEIDFGADGKLFYMFVGLAGDGNEPVGAFIVRSSDRARSFSTPKRILGPFGFQVRMAIDRSAGNSGRIHLTWLQAGADPPLGGFASVDNPILTAYSNDEGNTFSRPVTLNASQRTRVVAPSLAVAEDGHVHVSYFDLLDDARDYQGLEGPVWEGNWALLARSSGNGGRDFGREVAVTTKIVPSERVMLVFTMPPAGLAAGPNGRVCSAWGDSTLGSPDIFVRCGSQGKWGTRHRVNDDSLGSGKTQYLPRISFSENGRLDVLFYDRRRDARNVLNDVYFSHSSNARQFSKNVRVTADSFESRIGQQYANVSARGIFEFGSRIGISSFENGALAAWTDTRNSRLATPGQDIFSSWISLAR